MNALVPLIMFGWIPIVLGIFAVLPARRAVIAAFLFAWLFLPMAEYKVPGITAYSKMTATCAGILLAALIFDARRLFSFRPSWVDLPMALWCVCPFLSSVSNELGVYDGCSTVTYQTITWGVPYLIGRLYFRDWEGLRELAIGIFIGGLIYVPLCLYEVRMSPQLHNLVYGFTQAEFAETKRLGGWRPMVFMQHGLMVGMWMTTASLTGAWMWMTGQLRQLWRVPIGWLVVGLVFTTVLCKSSGAIALLAGGLIALCMARFLRSPILVWCLVLVAPVYIGARAGRMWTGDNLVSLAAKWLDKDRAHSMQFRLTNEDMLAAKALQHPVFGWGGWDRGRVHNEAGQDISVTDGLWIIALGKYGLAGLTTLTASFLLPVVLLLRRYPAEQWSRRHVAPAVAMAVTLALYMIDGTQNGMVNPTFAFMAGAISGTLIRYPQRSPVAQHRVAGKYMCALPMRRA